MASALLAGVVAGYAIAIPAGAISERFRVVVSLLGSLVIAAFALRIGLGG